MTPLTPPYFLLMKTPFLLVKSLSFCWLNLRFCHISQKLGQKCVKLISLDWFTGNFTGNRIFNGKNHGFRLRFSPTNQSNDHRFATKKTTPQGTLQAAPQAQWFGGHGRHLVAVGQDGMLRPTQWGSSGYPWFPCEPYYYLYMYNSHNIYIYI